MTAFSSVLSWLRSLWSKILNIRSAPFWQQYIKPYWKYAAAYTIGFTATSIFIWNYTKKLTNTTSLQLAVKIYGKYSARSLAKDPSRVEHIWKTYFPKAPTQPSLEAMSYHMMFRSMEFGNFDRCPKNRNKYEWFIDQHRHNELMISLQPSLPSFVGQPTTFTVNEHVKLHGICYYKNVSRNKNTKVMYHIHGGSFIGCEPAMFYELLYEISRRTGMIVYTLQYRLCPDNGTTVIEQVEDCVAGYRYLIDTLKVQPSNMCLMGESSGGSLVLLLLQKLNQMQNMKQPKCAVLQSPCTDLSYSLPSMQDNKPYDPVEAFAQFPNPCLDLAVGYVDGRGQKIPNDDEKDMDRRKDARYSPLYGEWKGLCDLYFIAAAHEMLLDDSKYAVEKAVKAGVNVEHHWCPFAFHVPATTFFDEGKDNLTRIVEYLKRKLNE